MQAVDKLSRNVFNKSFAMFRTARDEYIPKAFSLKWRMLIDYVNCWSSTLYTTFHREAILQTALEITGYSVKVQSQVQTITRAILPRNQLPSVSNSQRGWSCNQIFDSSTTFLNPLVGTNPLYGKRTVGFFFRHALPISLLILRKKPTVLRSIRGSIPFFRSARKFAKLREDIKWSKLGN